MTLFDFDYDILYKKSRFIIYINPIIFGSPHVDRWLRRLFHHIERMVNEEKRLVGRVLHAIGEHAHIFEHMGIVEWRCGRRIAKWHGECSIGLGGLELGGDEHGHIDEQTKHTRCQATHVANFRRIGFVSLAGVQKRVAGLSFLCQVGRLLIVGQANVIHAADERVARVTPSGLHWLLTLADGIVVAVRTREELDAAVRRLRECLEYLDVLVVRQTRHERVGQRRRLLDYLTQRTQNRVGQSALTTRRQQYVNVHDK